MPTGLPAIRRHRDGCHLIQTAQPRVQSTADTPCRGALDTEKRKTGRQESPGAGATARGTADHEGVDMAQTSQLTAARLREVLHYDHETGVFTWLVKTNRNVVVGSRAGCQRGAGGYRVIRIDKVLHRANRLAWLYMTGDHPTHEIDHKNCDRADDSWENLRPATPAQNRQNQRTPGSRNTTGKLGVYYDSNRRKFAATVRIDRKAHFVGRFATADEAHAAYVATKRQLHPFGTL